MGIKDEDPVALTASDILPHIAEVHIQSLPPGMRILHSDLIPTKYHNFWIVPRSLVFEETDDEDV